MSYVHVTKSPGRSIADYERVARELGSDPIKGQLLHLAGESDGALVTVDIWESKAHADRFASERLFPAFERAGLAMGGTEHLAVDATVTLGSMR